MGKISSPPPKFCDWRHENSAQNVAFSWFWRCKEYPCPLGPDVGFEGCWRFLSGVWYLNLVMDMVTGLWYTHVPIFGSLSWFWSCKGHPCPVSPDLGLWRTLEVCDWGLASWSWFWYGHRSLIQACLNFGSLLQFWRCKEHPCPSSPDMGLCRMLEDSEWGEASWSSFGHGNWSLIHPCSKF